MRLKCVQDEERFERRLKVELGSSPVTSLGVVLIVSGCPDTTPYPCSLAGMCVRMSVDAIVQSRCPDT